jgi:hypothetical protein
MRPRFFMPFAMHNSMMNQQRDKTINCGLVLLLLIVLAAPGVPVEGVAATLKACQHQHMDENHRHHDQHDSIDCISDSNCHHQQVTPVPMLGQIHQRRASTVLSFVHTI